MTGAVLEYALIPGVCSLLGMFLFYRLQVRKAALIYGIIVIAGLSVELRIESARPMLLASTLCNCAGVLLFIWGFKKIPERESSFWREKAASREALFKEEDSKRASLKKEVEKCEKDIVKTLRLYGAIKGMGESLSWEDMIPHIDYSVKQCLNIRDFQLFLLDDQLQGKFNKVLSRGANLQDPPFFSPAKASKIHQNQHETYLEIPILQGETQIGLLWCRTPSQLSEQTISDMLADSLELSGELAMGLQKARLFSSLEKLSRIDGLTGAYRRQVFNDRLQEEIRRARAFRTLFSIVIGDLDHFKAINDTYGHQAGDEVLRRVGEIMKESVYETDFVARYGGEEFVILFPQADPSGVRNKSESIRVKISQSSFRTGLYDLHVTISLGIAHYPEDGTDPEQLLRSADRSLYAAKDWGRNRVVDSSELRGR